jgi:alkanesulfonate monooxygenase SsuD/methylene tetrahydromethanopterin reductase-like flavin-dependent oxidoreductase (luciferase family)
MAITFGVHIGPQNISIDDLRRLWTYADGHGFRWVSVWDHFYEAPPVDGSSPHFEAVALMAAIACETRNVEIGNYVFCMAYRNPGLLTRSLICIDHLSGGRVAIGLGAGWHVMEHTAFGYEFRPPRQRLDMLEEGVRVIRMLLTQDRTTFHGTYFHLENASMEPKPLRQPMPIWIGGGGEQRTLRIAARHADGWNVPYIGPDVWKHKSQVLDMWCEKEGRDPATIKRSINLGFYMAPTDAEGAASRAALERSWGREGAENRGAGMLLGGPSQVVDRIGEYAAAGVTALNIAFRPPVNWDALQAFVEEVMPKFAG